MITNRFNLDLIMSGSGRRSMIIPEGYPFMTIINNTDNTITVYEGSTDHIPLLKVPNYTALTIPLRHRRDLIFDYINGGAVGTKYAQVIFSGENLNINGALGNPIATGNMNLATDSVGLARQNQLPADLSAGGNLKVDIQNPVNVQNATFTADKIKLTDPTGVNTAQVDSDGNLYTLTKNKVQRLVFADTTNVIDSYYPVGPSLTTALGDPLSDVRHLKNFNISIYNGYDADILVNVWIASNKGSTIQDFLQTSIFDTTLTIPTGTVKRITGMEYPDLKETFGYLSVQVWKQSATAGRLIIVVEGEPR